MGFKEYLFKKFNNSNETQETQETSKSLEDQRLEQELRAEGVSADDIDALKAERKKLEGESKALDEMKKYTGVKAVLKTLSEKWTGTKEGLQDFISKHPMLIKLAALGSALALTVVLNGCSAGVSVSVDGYVDPWNSNDEPSGIVDITDNNGQQGVQGPDGLYYFGGDGSSNNNANNGGQDAGEYDGPWVGGYDNGNNGTVVGGNNNGTIVDKGPNTNVIADENNGNLIVANNVGGGVQNITVIDNSVKVIVTGDNNVIILSEDGVQQPVVPDENARYMVIKGQDGKELWVVDTWTWTIINKIPDNPGNNPDDNPGNNQGNDNPGGNQGNSGNNQGDSGNNQGNNNPSINDPVVSDCPVDQLISKLAGRPVKVLSMTETLDANGEVRVYNIKNFKGYTGQVINIECEVLNLNNKNKESTSIYNLQLPIEAYHLVNFGNIVGTVTGEDIHRYDSAAMYTATTYDIVLSSEMSR